MSVESVQLFKLDLQSISLWGCFARIHLRNRSRY